MARNDVLRVLFFTTIFGISLSLMSGQKGEKVTSFIDALASVLFKPMGLIVRAARSACWACWALSSAIVILAATSKAVPTIPAIGLVLVLSVDRLICMAHVPPVTWWATASPPSWSSPGKAISTAQATAMLDGRPSSMRSPISVRP